MHYPTELQQKIAAAQMANSYNGGSIGAVGAQSGLDSSPRPSTEIEGCLNRANDALDRLAHRINALEDRLRPVIHATGSGSEGAVGAPKVALSPLGDAIRNLGDRADSANERLEALLTGLAL